MQQVVEEKLNQFIYALDFFLSANAEFLLEDIKVVYATQLQKLAKGYVVRGVVKIGDAYYSFELAYNTHTNKLVIKSRAFLFQLTYEEVKDFLAQAETEGESQ